MDVNDFFLIVGKPLPQPSIWEWFLRPIKMVILGMVYNWVYHTIIIIVNIILYIYM
jgi:hypothetical protein